MKRRHLISMVFIVLFAGILVLSLTKPVDADVVVTGAGTETANGCYADMGDGTWWNGDVYIYTAGIIDTDTYCRFGLAVDGGETQMYYGNLTGVVGAVACSEENMSAPTEYITDLLNAADPAPDPDTSFTIQEAGYCGITPEPPATTTASTTLIQNPNQDMFNAWVAFFASFITVMWILRRRV